VLRGRDGSPPAAWPLPVRSVGRVHDPAPLPWAPRRRLSARSSAEWRSIRWRLSERGKGRETIADGLPTERAVAWGGGRVYGRVTGAQGEPAMPVRRTELRDELAALIAAGRELSPDHDQALAEVFIDRVASRMAPPSRIREVLTVWGKPRHLVGAVILGLACLATASVLGVHQPASSNPVPAPLSAKAGAIPIVGKVPLVPPAPKVPPAPQAPAPKTAP